LRWINRLKRPAEENESGLLGTRGRLKRRAVREAHKVKVEVDGDRVTLRGHVSSWNEREAIQGTAWSAPGVRWVVNEVHVG
jgi:osmotically-inducible protein OsmY